jgi:hypothetical protein
MPLSSLVIEDFVQHLQAPGSIDLSFPRTKAEVGGAVGISLTEWLNRPIDVRAPVRSIAIVEVKDDSFTAIVIDTVADLPRFRIDGPMASIALLYEGMRSAPHAPSRGTVILAALPSRPVPPPGR